MRDDFVEYRPVRHLVSALDEICQFSGEQFSRKGRVTVARFQLLASDRIGVLDATRQVWQLTPHTRCGTRTAPPRQRR